MKRTTHLSTAERWLDLPALFLLLVILTTAHSRLIATEWTENLGVTRLLTYSGLVIGALLGFSRFSPRKAALLAVSYGMIIVPWRVGLLWGEGVLWQERLLSLGGRLSKIINQLYNQQAVTDNLLFIVLMCVLFWTLATFTSYTLVRYASPWRIILPVGISLVIIHHYDRYLTSRVWYLIIYLFFALLLVARLEFLRQRSEWKLRNTYIPPYLGLDFVRIALAVTAVVLILSWTAPALAEAVPAARETWSRATAPWMRLRNTFDNAFASLRSSVGLVAEYYGPVLPLGRGNRMADTHLFTVSTPPNPPLGTRFYWRARVYDEYLNGWNSNLITTATLNPTDFDFNFPDLDDNPQEPYAFAFTLATPLSTLMTVNQPVWVSRPVRIELEYSPEGLADIASIRGISPLRAGESYQIRASLNRVTIAQLRNSGENYPDWVTERYLQLPDNISQRTLDLAEQITSDEDTPYDKTIAITNWLRRNIEYSETVPALPAEQELVDWFLFDIKQGFCNYYATAEIVMLRALGIPARLGVGYAQGERMEGVPNAYIVRQRDAHAWPEVYFPGIGWVEFEPTVSQPVIVRPLGDRSDQEENSLSGFPDEEQQDPNLLDPRGGEEEDAGAVLGGSVISTVSAIGISVVAVGLLVLAVILLVPILRRRHVFERIPLLTIALENSFQRFGIKPPAVLQRWAQYARLTPLGRSYQEINYALLRLGRFLDNDSTPAERTLILNQEMPATEQTANLLLAEYQTAIYSQYYQPDLEKTRLAGNQIRFQSYRTLLDRLIEKIKLITGVYNSN